MDSGFRVELEEDGSGSTRQSWIETNNIYASLGVPEQECAEYYRFIDIHSVLFTVIHRGTRTSTNPSEVFKCHRPDGD